jgi:hypothetical protein
VAVNRRKPDRCVIHYKGGPGPAIARTAPKALLSGLERAPPLQRSADRDLVGVLEIAPHRETTS